MKRLQKCPSPALEALVESDSLAVFLDANVLIPQYLRAVFLDLAEADIFQPFWSQQVIAEVKRNLCLPAGSFRLPKARVDRFLREMRSSFPGAVAPDCRHLESTFSGLADAKDLHVAASALGISQSVPGGRAVVLVTANTRHLPHSAFEGTSVSSTTPDAFLDAVFLDTVTTRAWCSMRFAIGSSDRRLAGWSSSAVC
ncbi:PIN domain-containing protein [Roseateles sp. UC29_93]|uniref:PIN domain-containing protein n=1 Tax=Roseateles sp. UC29_93 TaxID=3350177 RepID=UPI0036710DFD